MTVSSLLAVTPHPRSGRLLAIETLETRLPMSANGLVELGTQPDGGLTGKIVYTHAGHGYTADNQGSGAWTTQRGEAVPDLVEDLGNQDQMTFLVDYLFRAGATVVPIRPVGHQPNEVVIDNADDSVEISGTWSESSSPIYFGGPNDVPYLFANTSSTETATVRYRPDIVDAGFYPVYAWARSGSDRVNQLYRVHHTGGATEVRIDHTKVGNGLVYLGTYYFDEGTDGFVEISNQSDESGVVIADMIRFGNGMGDINRGGGISGQTREDEAGLYWVQWHVDRSQGIATSEYRVSSRDRSATVSLSPRWAEWMNREQSGELADRVFVSFHSNAAGSRGVLGLLNGNNDANTRTPNMLQLATRLAREVNDDLVAQNGLYEHNWFDRGSNVVLDRSDIEFGEINNLRINNEFDATIVETAFHDNELDGQLMLDPKVRDAIARATYQGLVRYFRAVDGNSTPLTMAPPQVSEVRVDASAAGEVTIDWVAPTANLYAGDAPTGYRVYTSADGYGFDGGRVVSGGNNTSLTISGLEPAETYYFRVVATNDGGESPASEVVAAVPNGPISQILIVNGFDRLDRTLNPTQPYFGGSVQRTRPRFSNSFDYSVQVAEAVHQANPQLGIDTAANEAIVNGKTSLADYDAVFWILGEESSADDTFDATEQNLVTQFLNQGGKLFVSGAEIGWDLDNLNNGRNFYNNVLRSDYVSDDANTYQVTGTPGSIFADMNFSFDDGSQTYNVDYPDVITPAGGSTPALNYVGGTGGTAAVQFDGGEGEAKIVHLAFPWETITEPTDRAESMRRVLDFFGIETVSLTTREIILDNDDGPGVYNETGLWLTSLSPGYNGLTYRYSSPGIPASATWTYEATFSGQAQFFVQYVANDQRSTEVRYDIETGLGTEQLSINQRNNNLQWVSLGTYDVIAGTHTIRLDAQASTGGGFLAADAVRVVLTGSDIPGDYSRDGLLGPADYTIWRDQLGVTGSSLPADGNRDEVVDGQDFSLWKDAIVNPVAVASGEASLLSIRTSPPRSSEADSAPPIRRAAPRRSPPRDAIFANWRPAMRLR